MKKIEFEIVKFEGKEGVKILVLPPYSKYSRYYLSYDEASNTLSTYTYQREDDETDRTYYADTDVFGVILRDDVEWYVIDEDTGDVSVEWDADKEVPFVHTPIEWIAMPKTVM